MTIAIDPFAPADATGVLALIVPIQREEFGIAITAEDQPDLSDIPRFYQAGAGGFWVAKVQGRVIGTIGLKDIGASQAALRKMFVDASFRGRELGVARRLLQTLLDHARGRGVRDIFLGTTAAFLAAHRFYERQGFAEIAKEALPASFPLMAVDTKFYALRL